jgi:hypothetical protein
MAAAASAAYTVKAAMHTRHAPPSLQPFRKPTMRVRRPIPTFWTALALTAAATCSPAAEIDVADGRYCTATAQSLLGACRHGVSDVLLRAQAACINLPADADRLRCRLKADRQAIADRALCASQRQARGLLCLAYGEDRYAPGFAAADFQTDFHRPSPANPYQPLMPGNRWKLVGAGEAVTIEVFDKTKLIDGVRCVVLNDVVEVDGVVVEDTDDWFALRNDGAVFYCGESVRDFAVFAGDQPPEPELVSRSGSFKAGVEGSLPGLQMAAPPVAGTVYRQEFSPNNAEDAAQVLSTTYRFGDDADLDRFVPKALAQALCAAADCVVIAEFSPLEPGVPARKYYARGIGFFLDIKVDGGEVVQLAECNMDPRCASLGALAHR